MSERTPLLQSTQSNGSEDKEIKTYGASACFAICVNCIVGTGVFGLPFAFAKSGYALAAAILLIGITFNVLSMNYTLEFLARVQGITTALEKDNLESELIDDCELLESKDLLESDKRLTTDQDHGSQHLDSMKPLPVHQITYRKFDFVTASGLLCGPAGRFITLGIMFIYCTGTLWAYSAVFASSMNTLIFCDAAHEGTTWCNGTYYINLAVFGAIVVTLSLMQMGETAWVQTALAIYRVVAFSIIIVTLIIKLAKDGSQAVIDRANIVTPANFNNFSCAFGTCLLAITCHYNMPDLLQPLRNKEKYARTVSMLAMVLSCLAFLFIGLLGCVSFDDVNPLFTLNWDGYTACGNGWEKCNPNLPKDQQSHSVLAVAIKILILLFPSLCCASSYPIVAVTLAVNMESLVMTIFSKISQSVLNHPQLVSLSTRFCVAFFPLVLAAAFKKLEIIFSGCGLFGFALSLIIPCLLHFMSLRYCCKYWSVDEYVGGMSKEEYKKKVTATHYDIKFLSHFAVSMVCCLIATLCLGYALVNFIVINF